MLSLEGEHRREEKREKSTNCGCVRIGLRWNGICVSSFLFVCLMTF